MGQLFTTSAQQLHRAMNIAVLSCVGWAVFTQCIQKPQSSLKDTQNATQLSASGLEPMEVKFTFTYPGINGQLYPVHMSANFEPQLDANKALWNSVIVSDGGLLNANNESKTIKPDSNLALSYVASDNPDILTFNSGNPEIGRGLSLKLQRVKVSGILTWKAIGLRYFGYSTDIEDSHQIPN
ncbi:MAG: hypothetical protein RJB13_2514 [Pseudomonadota bacterium]